jgi:iron complex transport system substrate-binding protein
MRAGALAVLAFLVVAHAAKAGPRVLSLDQCADQYVLALSPRADIVGLSTRARNADSFLRAEAVNVPERRASLESVLTARPQVVVRYWGGDGRVLAALKQRGVRVLNIDDAVTFAGVAANIRMVAAGLGQPARGQAFIARMNAKLARAANGGGGRGILYLTSGGDTQGPGTLIDAMIRGAGFTNLATRPGFGVVSLEHLAIRPPSLVVLGFYDQDMAASERWSVGRSPLLARLAARKQALSLPGAILGCPAWFVADGALALAAWGRAHPREP